MGGRGGRDAAQVGDPIAERNQSTLEFVYDLEGAIYTLRAMLANFGSRKIFCKSSPIRESRSDTMRRATVKLSSRGHLPTQ